ncbi:LCP family protein [Gryllotalpicola protaetiae]|uniref:LytR family transcriptional regulator n=1 Tax=Gryllotalpicola protaetiae TaxID=2419771 RepID=A0A387BN40_9MICO|nr:LCP family protein [Gryllotalpicola protaetiae]AYG03842.1 LytR family transcriptional regulator [Gryllotalpicola protaetiae]
MTRYDDLPLYEPERKRRHWSDGRKKRLRRTISWLAFGLAVLLVAGVGYVGFTYFHFVNGVNKVSGVVSGDSKPGVAQNILLIGNDERPANMTAQQYQELSTTADGGSSNTDTMILLHVPADGSSATLISFPRDSWVSIPGHGKGKLNAAYVYGKTGASGTDQQKEAAGVKLLIDTIQNLTGLTVNHYVKVSLLSFYNIANSLGPVTVCLNNPVNDPYSGAHFPAGVQKLDARQALQFVRQRHGLPNGDLDRAARQQYFLSVEAQQILSAGTLLNPVKLNNVVGAVSSSLETDDKLNLVSLATQLKGLRSGGITSATIPLMADPYGTEDGQSVVLINYDALPDFMATVTGGKTAAQRVAATKAADPASVTVDVLNGAGTARGSSTALATLKSLGFQTGKPADAPASQQTTTVYFPKGDEAQAKAVSAAVPGAALAQSSDYKNVTVILGTDGLMPKGAADSSGGSSSQAPSAGSGGSGGSASSAPSPSAPTTNYSKTSCIN